MDHYPGNNGFSPPNPTAKKKRKTNNVAALRRAAAAAEGPRFPFAGSSNNGGSGCNMLPPTPLGGPNGMLVASNPFDDSPASMSGLSRATPNGYPGGMDFMMMMRPPGMLLPPASLPMNMNYAPMTSNANANMPRMPQNFGHSVGPMFNQPMMTRIPSSARPRLPRGAPPPYPNPQVSGPINTLSRMHMSMGNVNVANPAAQAPAASMINLNLSGMPAPTRTMPPLTSNDHKRKAPSFTIGQALLQSCQPFQFNVDGQICNRNPMSELTSHLLGKLPYNQSQPMASTVPCGSILQNHLMRPVNPRTIPILAADGKCPSRSPPLTLEQQVPDALPTACGGCELDVLPNEDAIMCGSGCEFWFHRECSGLTAMAHQFIITSPFAEWVCEFCYSTKDLPPIKFNH